MESEDEEDQDSKPVSKPAIADKAEKTEAQPMQSVESFQSEAKKEVKEEAKKEVKEEAKPIVVEETVAQQDTHQFEEPPKYEAPTQIIDDTPVESELAPKQEEIEIDDYF